MTPSLWLSAKVTDACPEISSPPSGVSGALLFGQKNPGRSRGDKPLCCHTVKALLREEKQGAVNCPYRTLSLYNHDFIRGKPGLQRA
jgi:hypothetical protein